jgi:hypothetical protein
MKLINKIRYFNEKSLFQRVSQLGASKKAQKHEIKFVIIQSATVIVNFAQDEVLILDFVHFTYIN